MDYVRELGAGRMAVASPLKWHGGKTYLAPKLVPYFPKQYVHRVHPYAGGLSELFSWPCEGISEVVSDCNGELTNFWQVLQDEKLFARFKRIVQTIPCSQHEFEIAKGVATRRYDPVTSAVAFFVRIRQSRQGLGKGFATLAKTRHRGGMNELASAWWNAVDGLDAVYERLRRVIVLKSDAIKVIKQQDGPDTFFYLDPPYVQETRTTKDSYEFEMSDDQHIELLTALMSVEGHFMLSGYPSRLYEDFVKKNQLDWWNADFDLPNNASSKATKERNIERIWMNYQPVIAS